jgi:hypothetical protein
VVAEGGRGKDDRKQNTLAPSGRPLLYYICLHADLLFSSRPPGLLVEGRVQEAASRPLILHVQRGLDRQWVLQP